MRAGVRVGHFGVSSHVPGPRSAHRAIGTAADGVGAIILVPLYALLLIGWVLAGALWLICFAVKAVFWLLLAVTAPIWGPIRGMSRHHRKTVLAKHIAWAKEVQASQARQAFTQAPTGQRVG